MSADGGKSKKQGRNKNICAAYRTSQTAEFNKARRIMRHLKKPHNVQQDCAWDALKRLSGILYSAQRSKLGLADFLAKQPQ